MTLLLHQPKPAAASYADDRFLLDELLSETRRGCRLNRDYVTAWKLYERYGRAHNGEALLNPIALQLHADLKVLMRRWKDNERTLKAIPRDVQAVGE